MTSITSINGVVLMSPSGSPNVADNARAMTRLLDINETM
jgi:hypothetical protein